MVLYGLSSHSAFSGMESGSVIFLSQVSSLMPKKQQEACVRSKLSILSFLSAYSAEHFFISLVYSPIFIIQILKINFDSLSTFGGHVYPFGLLMISVRKSNANWQKQKGDSGAPVSQLGLASGRAGSSVHFCSVCLGLLSREFPPSVFSKHETATAAPDLLSFQCYVQWARQSFWPRSSQTGDSGFGAKCMSIPGLVPVAGKSEGQISLLWILPPPLEVREMEGSTARWTSWEKTRYAVDVPAERKAGAVPRWILFVSIPRCPMGAQCSASPVLVRFRNVLRIRPPVPEKLQVRLHAGWPERALRGRAVFPSLQARMVSLGIQTNIFTSLITFIRLSFRK